MPRIIFKSNYIKPAYKNVSGFLHYIATREGVVKHTSDWGNLPATKKQKDAIQSLIKSYPDMKTLFEYDDYKKTPNRICADQLLQTATEIYLPEENADVAQYTQYIATRPGVQKEHTHGLFGMTDHLSLKNAMDELSSHTGNVWTHIISLKREDAQRLGYDEVAPWISLVRSQSAKLAQEMKIRPENLVWYGAFHNEGHHPHVHLVVYSKNPAEGYLTNRGIQSLRGQFAGEIFKQDLLFLYKEQTAARESLSEELKNALQILTITAQSGALENPALSPQFLLLVRRLSEIGGGKKTYGYLPKDIKKQVDELLNSFVKETPIANAYEEWNALRRDILSTYKDTPEVPLPLSQQKEFHHLKNTIIRSATEYLEPVPPEEVTPFLDTPLPLLEVKEEHQDEMEPKTDYQKGKQLLDSKDIPTAISHLEKASAQGYPPATYLLARLYETGDTVEIDERQAARYYSKIAEDNPYAAYRLARLLLDRESGYSNPKLGFYWLQHSANKGNSAAQYLLGKEYLTGNLVPASTDRALELLRKSAEAGNSFACYELARIYLYAVDTDKKEDTGLGYLRHAIRLGNPNAQNLLEHYQTPKITLASRSILSSFLSLLSTPPQPPKHLREPTGDHKLRSKIKRKKIALGQAPDDEQSMKT